MNVFYICNYKKWIESEKLLIIAADMVIVSDLICRIFARLYAQYIPKILIHAMFMKKIFSFLAVFVCAISLHAADYAYLVLTNTSGTNTVVCLTDIEISLSDNELQITNSEGTVDFVLTELVSMQFSEDGTLSAIENVLRADAPVDVYSVNGKKLGTYQNLNAAAAALNKGMYIITDGKNSQKMIVN